MNLLNQSNKNYNIGIKITFLISFISIILFFNDKYLVFKHYIRIHQVHLLVVLFIVLLIFFLLFNRQIYLDTITYLLCLRLIIYLIPLSYLEYIENYWGNYFTIIAAFFSYFIASQNQNKDITSLLNKIILVFIFIISLEVIYIFLYIKTHFFNINFNLFKYFMRIPLGGSNYIAAVLLPFLFFTYYSNLSAIIRYGVTLINVVTLLLIGSKNAIFLLIIFIFFKSIYGYYTFIKKSRKLVKSKILIAFFLLTVFLFALLIVIIVIWFFMKKWYMGMSYDSSSIYEFVNALTSNRLDIYLQEIIRWKNHIIFGNGLSYTSGYPRSHNWIIELLTQSGIVGLITFLVILIVWFKRVLLFIKQDKLVKSIFYFVIVILVQGLFEVTLFTIIIDILFWYMIGLTTAQINYIKKQHIDNQSISTL